MSQENAKAACMGAAESNGLSGVGRPRTINVVYASLQKRREEQEKYRQENLFWDEVNKLRNENGSALEALCDVLDKVIEENAELRRMIDRVDASSMLAHKTGIGLTLRLDNLDDRVFAITKKK